MSQGNSSVLTKVPRFRKILASRGTGRRRVCENPVLPLQLVHKSKISPLEKGGIQTPFLTALLHFTLVCVPEVVCVCCVCMEEVLQNGLLVHVSSPHYVQRRYVNLKSGRRRAFTAQKEPNAANQLLPPRADCRTCQHVICM